MTSKKVLRTTFAAVSAATLTILATPGIVLAEDEPPAAAAAPNYTDAGTVGIPEDLTGIPDKAFLNIHKYTSTAGDGTLKADGDESEVPSDAKAIQGVTFSAYRVVGVDLKTNEGWKIANKLVEQWKGLSAAKKETLEEFTYNGKDYPIQKPAKWSGPTDENGLAKSTELEPGLYVVIESLPDAKVYIEDGDPEGVASGSIVKAAPFIVAVPMTKPKRGDAPDPRNETTKWLKNVHVYPKNSQAGIAKAVKDADTRGLNNSGDQKQYSTAAYTLTADVPKGYEGPSSKSQTAKKFRNFQIVDEFHEKVNYAGTTAVTFQQGEDVSSRPSAGDPNHLVEGKDYNITINPAGKATDGTANIKRALVTLTETGLDKMAAYAAGHNDTKLVWELNAVFKNEPAPATLRNTAYVIPDYPNKKNSPYDVTDEVPPGTPHAEVESRYGKVNVTKVASNNPNKALEGVRFKLWVCNKAGDKKPVIEGGAIEPVRVNDKDEWTTDAAGKFSIEGLRVNDWKNDSSKTDGYIPKADQDFYCLEEIEAPKGYEKLPQMIQFQILSVTKTGQTSPENNQKEDVDWTKDLTIENVPSNGGFDLPLTGGAGVWPLIGLGGLLVAGSAGYAAYASRRKTVQA